MKRLQKAAWRLGLAATLIVAVFWGHAFAQMSIQLTGPNGQPYEITGRNVPRKDEALILYDSSYGPSTRTNPYGVEVIATPTGQKAGTGLIYEVQRVTSVWECQQQNNLSLCGNATIPQDGIVLSATGSKRDILKAWKPGERLIVHEEWARQAQSPVSVINPNPENNPLASGFPGYRGSNQLVLYDVRYGQPKTGTNEFGFEVTVRNGIVVDQEGSDSTIPPDGFVLSGHGKARSWLLTNAPLGAKISIDETSGTVTASIDYDTYLYQFDRRWNESPCATQASDEACRQIGAKRAEAVRLNQEGKPEQAIPTLQNALEALNLRIWQSYALFPSTTIRGVWHRPVETNATAIGQTLDRLKDAGFNSVFLETFFHGYTIFPSQTYKAYGFATPNPKFTETDILQAWVDEAHKRNMQVHVWFQTFYGGTRAFMPPGPILEKRPEWANVQFSALTPEAVPQAPASAASANGAKVAMPLSIDEHPLPPRMLAPKKPVPSTLETGGYFLDPANPEVQDFLLKLADEIATRYNIDGFQLDYIRYPASFPPDRYSYRKTTWGYTDLARAQFKAAYGVDPVDIDPKKPEQDRLWQTWNDFKTAQVNRFVERVSLLMRQKHPNVKLSAAVFPDIAAALGQKSQDWQGWAQRGWIDFFAPMTLTSSNKVIERDVRTMVNTTQGRLPIYAGLFGPFNDAPAELVLSQIDTAKRAGASGYVMFDSAHLTRRDLEALKMAQNPEPAVVPAMIQPGPQPTPPAPTKKRRWWHFKK